MVANAVGMVLFLNGLEASAETRFSLSIGNNLGASNDEPLRWAERDAERIHGSLGDLAGVSDDRRLLLLGTTRHELFLAMERLRGRVEEAKRRGDRTVLYVFYSGHGGANSLRMQNTELPMARFKTLIQRIPSTTTVAFIDACYSGSLLRGRAKGMKLRPAFEVSFEHEVGPEGRVYISSATSTEVAQESDLLQSSYFTHHLLSGLRGAADSDQDGSVTLAEVYRYVYHRTLVSSHGGAGVAQHPKMDADLVGEAELVVTRLERAKATLRVPAEMLGSVLVINDRSSRVIAEVQKTQKREVSICIVRWPLPSSATP